MKHRILAAMAIGLTIVAPLSAQRPTPTTAAITAADLRQRLFRIADDSMKGRDTGSPEDSMTADYVAAEFKRLGLKPAGEHGGWFQTVPFFVPASATSLTVRDGTLKARTDFVVIGRPNSAPATTEFTAVYGGTAGDTSTWISEADAAGKVVVFDLKAVNGATPTFSNALFNNPRFAHARGIAIAALGVVSPAQQATLMRAPRPALDTTRGPARPFQMLLTPAAAVKLMAASPIQGDPSPHWVPIAHLARNVVGIVPGSDSKLRNTYVSLTAHNDHVGICGSGAVDHDSLRAFNRMFRPMGADTRTFVVATDSQLKLQHHLLDSLRAIRPARPDSICNGADDDGSGTVSILELAEYFASLPQAQRPKRSILFVSHVAEEVGLVGSQWYTDHPTVPIDSIVAEIDMDMVGRGGATDLPGGGPAYLEVVGLRRLSNEFGDLMEEANKAQKLPFVFNYEFDVPGHPLQYYCRADHYNYARYGIPSWSISRGEHLDYHQVTDEPQYIDYDSMLRVVTLVRDGAIKVGNLDHAPKLDKPKQTDPHVRCVQ